MKLVRSNGRELEVYDVAGPVYRITATALPIKCNGYFLIDDDQARDLVRDLVKLQGQGGARLSEDAAEIGKIRPTGSKAGGLWH